MTQSAPNGDGVGKENFDIPKDRCEPYLGTVSVCVALQIRYSRLSEACMFEPRLVIYVQYQHAHYGVSE